MKTQLNTSALFYKGKLFQIGDIITCKVGFLNTISGSGFDHFNTSGVLTKIIIEVDTICNSGYLNNGFVYNSIGSLGYKFELDNNNIQYAFESDVLHFPYGVMDCNRYIHNYYSHPINSDKWTHLQSYLNIPKTTNIGHYLRKNHREIYNYICLTFRIRFGEFGLFNDSNDLSNISFKILKEFGEFNNNVNNVIYKFIQHDSSTCKNLYISN